MFHEPAPSPIGRVFDDKRTTVQSFATHIPPQQRVKYEWHQRSIMNEDNSEANKEIQQINLDLDDIQVKNPKPARRKISEKHIFLGMAVVAVLVLVITLSVILTRDAHLSLKSCLLILPLGLNCLMLRLLSISLICCNLNHVFLNTSCNSMFFELHFVGLNLQLNTNVLRTPTSESLLVTVNRRFLCIFR